MWQFYNNVHNDKNIIFLTAIREDRTRGGRSTYQCAPYPLPPSIAGPSPPGSHSNSMEGHHRLGEGAVKCEPQDNDDVTINHVTPRGEKPRVPLLLQVSLDNDD